MDWFTLRTLADEWDAALAGARVADVWTQSPRELSVLLETPDGAPWTLRVVCDPASTTVFRTPGGGRQKRNTAAVFPDLVGRTVASVRVADRDRHLLVGLDGGGALQALLFGSRPTVLWTEGARDARTVRDAFLQAPLWVGEPAPTPRAAPDPSTPEAVATRWPETARTLSQAVRRAAPLLPPALADAAIRDAGLSPTDAPPTTCPDALAASVAALRTDLETPRPAVLWRGEIAEALVPLPPASLPDGWRAEPFENADEAVRVYARRALGQQRFQALYRPVEAALASVAARRARSAEAMLDELSQPSRADRYQHWAHLLMASAAGQPAGAESVTLPDLIAGTDEPITVPLDPARTAVENAERLYDKARRTRGAREAAEARWGSVQADADAAAALLAELRAVDRVPDLQAFLDTHAGALGAALRPEATGGASEPFRRIALGGGWEALVGKNGRSNAHLTTRVARPHDLWLHARGVPGSHVVVPRASRTQEVPPHVVEAAARLAAGYSEARTQSVVPVTVTERKYVRPVKGGPLGLVRVDRERVVDVVPAER